MTDVDLPVTVEKSAVLGLVVTEDGSKQLSGVFYSGSGTEADQVVAYAGGLPGPSMVIRDASRTASDIRDPVKLAAIATADLKAHRYPIEQWSFTVDTGPDGVARSSIRLGSILRLAVYGHVWIADGIYEMRVIGFTPTVGKQSIAVEVQAWPTT